MTERIGAKGNRGREDMTPIIIGMFPNEINPSWSKKHPWVLLGVKDRLEFIRQMLYHYSRSEEHTSELQSRGHLVCRLLLEKKKKCRKTLSSVMHSRIEGTAGSTDETLSVG